VHFTFPNCDKFLYRWYMQFVFSLDLNIRMCQEINITHTFYNLYLYRTINKYSHVKYNYCFVPVILADINLIESCPCEYFYFINCFNCYNSVVTVSFIKFCVSLALYIQILFFWILMSLSVLKTVSLFLRNVCIHVHNCTLP